MTDSDGRCAQVEQSLFGLPGNRDLLGYVLLCLRRIREYTVAKSGYLSERLKQDYGIDDKFVWSRWEGFVEQRMRAAHRAVWLKLMQMDSLPLESPGDHSSTQIVWRKPDQS